MWLFFLNNIEIYRWIVVIYSWECLPEICRSLCSSTETICTRYYNNNLHQWILRTKWFTENCLHLSCLISTMLCLRHSAQVRFRDAPLHRRTRHKRNKTSPPEHRAHEPIIKLAPKAMDRASWRGENKLEVVLGGVDLSYIKVRPHHASKKWVQNRLAGEQRWCVQASPWWDEKTKQRLGQQTENLN